MINQWCQKHYDGLRAEGATAQEQRRGSSVSGVPEVHRPPLRTDDGADIHGWPVTAANLLSPPMPAEPSMATPGIVAVAAAPPPPPPACPVAEGVVDASRCTGYSPEDATGALQAAFHSGAHTVLVKNQSMTPWILTQTVWLGSNQTIILEAGAVIEAQRFATFWNDSVAPSRPRPLISTAQAGSFNITIKGAAGAILRMVSETSSNSHPLWEMPPFPPIAVPIPSRFRRLAGPIHV